MLYYTPNWRKSKLQERILQLQRKKADFIIKIIECPVQALLWRHCDVGVVIWFTFFKLTNFSIFQVVIAVRITDLVMNKISYEDKMRIQTFHEIGIRPFDYQATFVHIFFLPADQTWSFWRLTGGFRIKLFSSVKKTFFANFTGRQKSTCENCDFPGRCFTR